MTNTITASITFSFKGKTFTPSSTIDLDVHMQGNGRVPDLHMLLATDNNIGLYSYEYEMLQAEIIHINQAQGLVADYVKDGILDTAAFELAWQEQQIYKIIHNIIEAHGLNQALQQHPDLENALFEIYQAGQDANPS